MHPHVAFDLSGGPDSAIRSGSGGTWALADDDAVAVAGREPAPRVVAPDQIVLRRKAGLMEAGSGIIAVHAARALRDAGRRPAGA